MLASPLLKYLHTFQFYFIQKLHALSPERVSHVPHGKSWQRAIPIKLNASNSVDCTKKKEKS